MNNNMNNMGMNGMGMGGGMAPNLAMNGAMGNGSMGGMGAINPMNMGMNSMGGGGMGMNMNMGMGNMGNMAGNMAGNIAGNMGASRPGGGINPSQLMGISGGSTGMGMGGGAGGGMNSMNPMGGMGNLNPTQLLQSQHQHQQRDRDNQMAMQQSHQRGGPGMGMGMGMGMGGGGGYGVNNMNGIGSMGNIGMGGNYSSMNPAAISSSPTASSPIGMGMMGGDAGQRPNPMGGPSLSGMGGMMNPQNHQQHPSNPMQPHSLSQNPNPMSSQNPNPNPAPNPIPPQMQHMLHAMGITTERFQSMSTQDRQVVMKQMAMLYNRGNNANNHHPNANTHPQPTSISLSSPSNGNFYGGDMHQAREQPRPVAPNMEPQRPGSSGGFAGLSDGMGGNMMPPPPRPTTAMSMGNSRAGSAMGMPPNMGMNTMGGMGMNSSMNGMGNMPSGMGNNMGGIGNIGMGMPNSMGNNMGNNMNNMNNVAMTAGTGLSRPGTSMTMRSANMSGGVNMGMGVDMNTISGMNQMNHMGMGGMNMPRHPSNPPVGTPGSSGGAPGSPMRPPSRAMSSSSIGGNDGPIVNGYPNTPKHTQGPGTPQMGHALPQQLQQSLPQTPQHPQHYSQNMHQGSPPPTPGSAIPNSPSLGGTPHPRRGSPMPTPSGRGTPNPLKRKASGLESPKMGPPSGIPLHNNLERPERPSSAMQNGIGIGKPPLNNMSIGMGLARPETGSPTTSGPAPGITQRESTPGSASMPPTSALDAFPLSDISLQKDGDNSIDASKPRVGSLPPATAVSNTASVETSGTTSHAPAGLMPNGPIKIVPKLPPLPATVDLNPLVTDVQVVPVAGSDQTIPQLTPVEIKDIKRWQKVDFAHNEVHKAMRTRMDLELKGDVRSRDYLALLDAGEFGNLGGKAGVLGNASIKWWEKGALSVNPGARFRRGREGGFDIRYPGKRRDHGRNKKAIKREGFRLPGRLNPEDANRPEQLVPIRIEFDVDHHKYRDTFIWNLSDPIITPELFAQTVVEDYQLAPSYHTLIVKSIQEQVSDYKAHSTLYDGEGGEYLGDDNDPSLTERGLLDAEDAIWWENWRKRLRTEYGFVKTGKGSGKGRRKRKVNDTKEGSAEDADVEDATDLEPVIDGTAMAVVEFRVDERKMTEDMRILIKLDIIVGSMKLDDQFEWDLDNVNASPEQFAEVYTQDLGLGGEFRTAIAHAIREQTQIYQKSLFLVGRPTDGSAIQDEDLRSAFLPSLSEGARAMDQVQSFTPLLNYLSDGEIERNEKERDKDMTRRRKRNTRGRRGVTLPDREPIRSYRTPAIGFPELDAATLALAAAANAPVSRRAAAAAASLTIANMVASENGTPLTPLTLPSAPQQPTAVSVVKEKKVKGLFKAPPLPPSVIRLRAKVKAPTPTTAADISSLPASSENDVVPSASTPDSRSLRSLSSKKVKELEREAKEKEQLELQHPNYIEGVWHCSNCGCPENIAVGRRKGPLGDKSQCGECGKYWHRHRRTRPCTYTVDNDYHNERKREAELAELETPRNENSKTSPKKKGTAAALRAQSSTVPSTPVDDSSAPPTPVPAPRKKESSEAPSKPSPPPPRRAASVKEEEHPMSPISSASSASEPPLSQKVKLTNGTSAAPHSSHSSSPPPPQDSKPTETKDSNPKNTPSTSTPRPTAQSPPTSPSKWPPSWLTTAMHSTQMKYPNDKFEVVLRKVGDAGTPEWRIKCVDCPGKLYKPGPGEALLNFEVHLKNRQHRQRVDERTAK